jgi:hypothetical protein
VINGALLPGREKKPVATGQREPAGSGIFVSAAGAPADI